MSDHHNNQKEYTSDSDEYDNILSKKKRPIKQEEQKQPETPGNYPIKSKSFYEVPDYNKINQSLTKSMLTPNSQPQDQDPSQNIFL